MSEKCVEDFRNYGLDLPGHAPVVSGATIDSVSNYREPTRQGPIIFIILIVFLAFAIGVALYFYGVAGVAGS